MFRSMIVSAIAALILMSCSDVDPLPSLYTTEAFEDAEPELAATLRAQFGFSPAPSAEGADAILDITAEGATLKAGPGSIPMDRRDPAFADVIDTSTDDQVALALVISTRLLAMDLASSSEAETAEDDAIILEMLVSQAGGIAERLDELEGTSPLTDDLRTSYRQALFQIATTSGLKANAAALLAFEKAEAKEGRGVDVPNRFEAARAWYYFASANHLLSDLSSERDIASAFSGFKDAQRPAIREREVDKSTPQMDQDLIAARVRIGQLLTAIGNLRDDDKLREEAAFAFRSAAGLWYEVMGTEQTFCYRIDLLQDTEPTCIAPSEAELPTFVPS